MWILGLKGLTGQGGGANKEQGEKSCIVSRNNFIFESEE